MQQQMRQHQAFAGMSPPQQNQFLSQMPPPQRQQFLQQHKQVLEAMRARALQQQQQQGQQPPAAAAAAAAGGAAPAASSISEPERVEAARQEAVYRRKAEDADRLAKELLGKEEEESKKDR